MKSTFPKEIPKVMAQHGGNQAVRQSKSETFNYCRSRDHGGGRSSSSEKRRY